MKKTIRFVFAVILAPIMVFFMFLDWLYEGNTGLAEDWKKDLFLKSLKSPFPHQAVEDLEIEAVKEAEDKKY